ncbi:hypothetical protein PVAND_003462 [Polypedilum vanderplanki]|uniref:Uncharacterized protein n=1 Tax=Polypedilum vanderplanki TaxID=319348 RepID=A0A9J6BUK8_POLVA|nr:hypothetical protein PVAND_003462 [Polypedilum vanderplanki]
MSMRSNRYEREEPPPRGKCLTCICVSWKIFSYVFSHVTLIALVVLYCVAGGFLFQKLEEDNEREVRKGIVHIRGNTTKKLWDITNKMEYLKQENWTKLAIEQLQGFETSLLNEMKEKGWDGIEMTDNNKTQW